MTRDPKARDRKKKNQKPNIPNHQKQENKKQTRILERETNKPENPNYQRQETKRPETPETRDKTPETRHQKQDSSCQT